MKKVNSFEEACESRGFDPAALPDVSAIPEHFRQAVIDHYQLMVITEAINDGERPAQRSYSPWFIKGDGTGSGFRLGLVNCDITPANVGARLGFVSERGAEHAGTAFCDLYKKYHLYLPEPV